MLEDPSEPAFVRELLQAGVDDEVSDYDYRVGLAKHVAIIAAGTMLPLWAKSVISASSASSGVSAKVIAFVIGLPVATAAVVASLLISTGNTEGPPSQSPKAVTEHVSKSSSLAEPKKVKPITIAPAVSHAKAERPGAVAQQPETRALRGANQKPREGQPAPFSPLKAISEAKASASEELLSSEPEESEFISGRTSSRQPRGERSTLNQPVLSRVLEKRDFPQQRKTVQQESKPVTISAFQRETRMLAAANRLLESDPERALELAEKGEREFPNSMFTEERRHVLILALINLSRVDEAKQLAGPYLLDYPQSPFAQRVRHALAKAQREK